MKRFRGQAHGRFPFVHLHQDTNEKVVAIPDLRRVRDPELESGHAGPHGLGNLQCHLRQYPRLLEISRLLLDSGQIGQGLCLFGAIARLPDQDQSALQGLPRRRRLAEGKLNLPDAIQRNDLLKPVSDSPTQLQRLPVQPKR